MAVDMTNYLNNAKAKLGNAAVVHANGNTTYRVKTSMVEEWYAPTVLSVPLGTQMDAATYYNFQKVIATHPITAIPDNVATELKTIMDIKLKGL